MAWMPDDPNAAILDYGTVVDGAVHVTPDQLLTALCERFFPAMASGDAHWADAACVIDGWKVRVVDAADPAWDAYRPAPPEPEPPPLEEGDEI